ncbi:hypothetical protein SBOR_1240 [Sclerotinia borealis F-4128]|uniref:Palmitoyltransferase n=1 Tax=Sclerotinia borealis (strain F-4128) TaxID=1432307 RepID=W9CNL2_SCLBF|nr:hypothetical protein SBOR_1240 [Sclerotinia borealis F-4128]
MLHSDIERNKRAANIWTARLMPFVLAGVVGYVTYVLVVILCVNYLLVEQKNRGAAVPILIIYFLLFILMASSFFRVVYMTTFDPPYAPLGAGAARIQRARKRKDDDIAGEEYTSGDFDASKDDPDSPGLELFYTKDVFGVEGDGKPRWCSECCIWKLDRQHHCSVVGRCIYKMDHYCPWVGGPIGENNFKFFIQFVGYTALFCINVLVVMATYIHQQRDTQGESVNHQLIAVLALAAFFGLFTGTMFLTSVRLTLNNLTQVEDVIRHGKIHKLAILKPSPQRLAEISVTAASTQTYSEITYPLDIPPHSDGNRIHRPYVRTIRHDRLSEPISLQDARRMASLTDVPINSAVEPTDENSHLRYLRSDSTQVGTVDDSSTTLSQSQNIETSTIDELQLPIENSERLKRDQKAVRTFAILETTSTGDNPWDLGSALLNWETVMGEYFIDWFLPIKRSPCCNHENTESHFSIGPSVDRIRASVCFIPPNEVRPERRHRRKEGQASRSRRRFSPNDEEKGRNTDGTELRDLHTRETPRIVPQRLSVERFKDRTIILESSPIERNHEPELDLKSSMVQTPTARPSSRLLVDLCNVANEERND